MFFRSRVVILATAVAVAAVAAARPHRASANTCTSTGTGSWNTVATWSGCGGTVPQAGDDVVIAAAHTVTVDVSTNALASLSVDGTLTIGNNSTARTVTVTGDLTIASGATVQVLTTSNNNHELSLGGNLSNAGTFSGEPDADSEIRITFSNTSVNQTVSGAGTTTFGRVNVAKGSQSLKVVCTANVTVSGEANDFDLGDGTDAGTWEQSAGTLTKAASTVQITNDGGLIVSGSGSFTLSDDNLDVDGILTVNTSGTFAMGDGASSLNATTNAVVTLTAGAVDIFGRFNATAGSTTTITGATIRIDPQATNNLGAGDVVNFAGGANVTMSGGSITIVDPKAANGDNEVQIVSGGGSKSFSGGTIYLGDGTSTTAGSTDAFRVNAGVPIFNLTIRNQGGGTNRFVDMVMNDLDLNGSLVIESGGTLQQNSRDINVAGDWTNSGTFTRTATFDVTFDGTGTQTIAGSSTTGFADWFIVAGATVVVPAANQPTAETNVSNQGTLIQTRTVNAASVAFLDVRNAADSASTYRAVVVDTTGSGDNLGSTTVTVRGNTVSCTTTGAGSPDARRCYSIAPSSEGDAVVTLNAFNAGGPFDERNTIADANLRVYQYTGPSTWTNISSGAGSAGGAFSFNSGDTASGEPIPISGEGIHFLLAATGASPTAVTLAGLSATAGAGRAPLAALGLVVLALTTVGLRRAAGPGAARRHG